MGAGAAEEVEALKAQGNALFAQGQWLKSAGQYTQAIKADPGNATLYSNRSAALLKLLKVTKAMEDAERCIKLRPEWEKGYFRKGAILEEQGNTGAAIELYQQALKLVPDSRELSQRVHTLRNKLSKASRQKAPASSTTTAPAAPAASSSNGSSKGKKAKQPRPQDPQVVPADLLADDMGSEEVARFAGECLEVMRGDYSDGQLVPTVHFLPGRALSSSEEQQAHVRCAGGFESPETLQGLVGFLRSGAEKLAAKAVLSCVPKQDVGFPRTWQKPKWPAGDRPGVFVQLEGPKRLAFFIPYVDGPRKAFQDPIPLDYDSFALFPRLLKAAERG